MCVVLAATHGQSGDELVVHLLLPETATSLSIHARFLREIQSAARLRSEHAAWIIDLGVLPDGVPFYVTMAARGVDLAGELVRLGTLNPEDAVEIALQACTGLAEAHALGIVHRNVTPANLVITAPPGGAAVIKLLDPGITKAPPGAPDPITRIEPPAGPIGYMSPEQLRGEELDGRADIWALGAVLYELLTGQRPFKPEASGARTSAEPPPAMDPRIPPGLQDVVLHCLVRDRDARFLSVAALAAALAPYAHDPHAAAARVERIAMFLHGGAPAEPLPMPAMMIMPAATAATMPPQPRRGPRRIATIALVALAVSVSGIATAALITATRSRSAAPNAPAAGAAADAPSGTSAANPPAEGSANGPATRVAVPAATAAANAPSADAANEPVPVAANAPSVAAAANAPSADSADRTATAPPKTSAAMDAASETSAANPAATSSRTHIASADPAPADRPARAATSPASAPPKTTGSAAASGAESRPPPPQLVAATAARSASRTPATPSADDAPPSPRSSSSAASPPANHHESRPSNNASDERVSSKSGRSCDSMNVDDVMTRAAIQFDSGAAGSALSLTRVALGCRQTDRMYWLATMYACAAHDIASARLYFPRVPANLQSGIEHKCQQNNLDVRSR